MIDRSLIEAATRLRRHGEPYVIATVVRARTPGARLILTRYRWLAGTVSGGGFDGELAASAWMHTKDAGPVVLTYDPAHPDIGGDDDLRAAFGLGDGGSVDVLLERAGVLGRIEVLELAARCTKLQRRAAIATVIRSDASSVRVGARIALVAGGEIKQESAPIDATLRDAIERDLRAVLETGTTLVTTYGAIDVMIEALRPPPRLFVFGSGPDVVPLAQLARQVGWEVVICAASERHTTRERFTCADEILVGEPADLAARIDQAERAVCVVATHDAERDRACLGMLRGTRALSIGVVGRTYERESPQELALAIVGEIQTTLLGPTRELRAAVARPVPSRPSAMFAAIAAL